MIHSSLGLVHTVAAVAALILGVGIFLRRKTGKVHKVSGYLYSVSMLTLNVTALFIFRLTGSFNLLHLFALLSLIALGIALYYAVTRRSKTWIEKHYLWMSWSYIGLFAAFIAETASRVGVPYLYRNYGVRSFGWFWAIVIFVSFLVCFIGGYLVATNRGAVKRYSAKQ